MKLAHHSIILLILTTVNSYRLISLNDKNGILPFEIGKGRIRETSYSYIHRVNLETYADLHDNILHTYNSLPTIVKNYGYQYHNVTLIIIHRKLEQIRHKINSLLPNYKFTNRHKRGLFDGIGTAIKFLTGNLDSNDAHKYNEAFMKLQKNQNKLIEHDQLLVNNLEILDERTRIITKHFEIFQNNTLNWLQNFTKTASHYQHHYSAKLIFDDILYQTLELESYLKTLIDFTSLAKHNIIDANFISLNELLTLHNQIKQNHSLNCFNITDDLDLLEIITIKIFQQRSILNIILEFPLLQDLIYNVYHLLPVPNKQDLVILPKYSYLLWKDSHHYHFTNTLDLRINDVFYIKENNNFLDSCIVNLFNFNNNSLCKYITLQQTKNVVEEIYENYLLLILKFETLIELRCEHTESKQLKGNYILNFENCNIKVENKTYYRKLVNKDYSLWILPEIVRNIHSNQIENFKINLNSEHINIKNISHVDKILQTDISWNSSYHYYILYVTLLIIICISVCIYKKKFIITKCYQLFPKNVRTTEPAEPTEYVTTEEIKPSSHNFPVFQRGAVM